MKAKRKKFRFVIQVVEVKDDRSLATEDNTIARTSLMDLRLDSLKHWASVIQVPIGVAKKV